MALELKLDDKPFYWGLGIGLLLAALVVGGLEYGYFSKQRKEITNDKARLAKLEQEIQKGRAAEKKIVQFKEEVKKLELELEKLLRILPADLNTDELIKKFETLANQGEITVQRISSKPFNVREFYKEWPIQLSVQGSYHNLALFFDKLSRFTRIINVDQLHIVATPTSADPAQSIGANFIAKTYIYIDDEKK